MFNTFKKLPTVQKVLLVVCVAVIVVAICCPLFVNKLITGKLVEKFGEDGQNTFVFFFAPWCGHCQSTKPEWDKLKKNPPANCKLVEVNCDDEPKVAEQNDIQGFPTFKLFKNGSVIDYDGERTSDAMTQFIQQH